MSSISAIFFLDSKGKPVLYRDYRCVPLVGPAVLAAAAGGDVAAAPPASLPRQHPACRACCRGDVPLKAADRFLAKLGELEEAGKATPVILDENVTYMYVQYSNLYLLAVTRSNVNAAAVLVFLHKLIEIFRHYFTEVRGSPAAAGCIVPRLAQRCAQPGLR